MNDLNTTTVKQPLYDFVGIGIGPFNLGLACLCEPIPTINCIFLDKKEEFNWHPGMLLQDTTLQIPFLADLVTLADPTNPFSFLNYIKEQGRIYSFYIRENFLLLRNEYNQYCRWAIKKLSNLYFNTQVNHIDYDDIRKIYTITTQDTKNGTLNIYQTKRIVFGTGTVPDVPACCKHLNDLTVHSASYLHQKETLQKKPSITVLGSGQSAAEIYYDLLQDIDVHQYELHWITRSPRFFPLEYSKLTLEMTSPEYVDYFYQLPPRKKDALISQQKHLYKGVNNELLSAIYDLLYTKRLTYDLKVSLRTNSELKKIEFHEKNRVFDMEFYQAEEEKYFKHSSGGVVLATGYNYALPDFIDGISSRIRWDQKGRYEVSRHYSIDLDGNQLFVQNAELHTHGFVTPDLGMACYRNSCLIKEITGKDYYPIETKIAFQQFHVTEQEEIKKKETEFV